MFIDKIHLENFKCFARADLKLSKLTILLGANSSGKSSLIYGLLGAVQSDSFPLYFSPNGEYVNMGDFEAISRKHSKSNEIVVGFELSDPASPKVSTQGRYAENSGNKMPQLSSAEYTDPMFSLKVAKHRRYSADWSYSPSVDPMRRAMAEDQEFKSFLDTMESLMRTMEAKHAASGKGIKDADLSPAIVFSLDDDSPKGGQFQFDNPRDFTAAAGAQRNFLLSPRFVAVSNTLQTFGKSFNYIGSFRYAPQRTYYQASKSALKVGRYGENYIDQISEWEYRNADEFDQLRRNLTKLQLLKDMRISRMRGGRFDVVVKAGGGSVPASLADVGFGLSQFIPIAVADLQLSGGSTLAISQPELHLHPKVQADIANYFVDETLNGDKRYIIETHSEYFINRVRLLVAEERVKEEDVSVVYLSNSSNGSQLTEISFLKNGQIANAPEDFFETYMMDVMNIALHA